MLFKVLETLSVYVFVCALAFDDVFVDGNDSHDMIDQGRTQYQLLREKGNLPRYGTCWKGAIDHVEDGCKNLSEDTQSFMALHLTNCFLEMSGHETYNCELNRKANLRMICINGMSDRAFHVYTEFYTHVQNICWFLRGQIWHETISESSFRVGQQLEVSAQNQRELLDTQREFLEVQRKILVHEKMLEEVLGDLYVSTKAHRDILNVLANSVASFQTWVIGEISWFDSVTFYVVLGLFIFILTSLKRTSAARLPLLLILFVNFLVERFICYVLISEDSLFDAKLLYQDIYNYVWYCRYFFICVIFIYLICHSYNYKDMMRENNKFLQSIKAQNTTILDMLNALNDHFLRQRRGQSSPKSDTFNSSFNCINENLTHNGFLKTNPDFDESSNSSFPDTLIKARKTYSSRAHLLGESYISRYNLRSSKQNTPELS